jgi:RNA polymerase sigma-70 factor (ECF subfamily)
VDPSPVVRLNRAVVLAHVRGPAAALDEIDLLAARMGRYHLFHATRASLLRDLGRAAEAQQSDVEALRLTANPAERHLLSSRLRMGAAG